MSRFIGLFLIALLLFQMTACTYQKTIDGVTYGDYGLFNESDNKNPNVRYEPAWGNIILGAVLFETLIAPFYVFGYHMMQPVGHKSSIPGQVEPRSR